MEDNKEKGGLSSYIDATKKANEAKKGLMVKKTIHQLPQNNTPTTVEVKTGTRRAESPDSPASKLGWESTAKLFEDEEDSKNERTETRKLQPATVDEVFK